MYNNSTIISRANLDRRISNFYDIAEKIFLF
jgi:hypothetical protein